MLVTVSIRSSDKRGVFGVGVIMSAVFVIRTVLTAAGRFLGLGPASIDNLLPEASRVNLHVIDAREAGVPGVARLAGPTRLMDVRIARYSCASFLRDRAVLISVVVLMGIGVAMRMFVVAVGVAGVIVIVAMVMVVSAGPVGVAMSAENDETNEVRGKAEGSNNQDQFRVFDGGWVDESAEGFEDDGDAKRNQEYGVEEGTENFRAQPLRQSYNQSVKEHRIKNYHRIAILTP